MSATAQTVEEPTLGTIHLRKVRGSKHVRLRIRPDGSVQLTMPYFTSFRAGLQYARTQASWIQKHRFDKPIYRTGDKVGQTMRFSFVPHTGSNTQTRRNDTLLLVRYPEALGATHPSVQAAAHDLAHRGLKHEAETLLPDWLQGIANEYGYEFRTCKVRRLRSRWGSCSSQKDITLNIFLTKLPDELIEYVLLHELTHTRHLNHSAEFWADLQKVLPNVKMLRKQLRAYQPSL